MNNKIDKQFKFSSKDPLHEKDTLTQTFGCRCYNPDICRGNGGENCAFYNSNHICYTPPKSWKKTYNELSTNK